MKPLMMKSMGRKSSYIDNRKKRKEKMSGIYFLFQGGAMVYIGQSKNVERRLATHNIKHDSYRVIPCAISDLLYYEKRLINYFNPELNGHPGGKREGAGRKVGSYSNGGKKESVVMRIPVSMVPMVTEYINLWKSGMSDEEIDRLLSAKYETYASHAAPKTSK